MSISDISTRIQSNTANNQIPLSNAVLDSPILIQYIAALFDTTPATMVVQSVTPAASTLTVTGSAVLFGNPATAVTLTFTENANGTVTDEFTAELAAFQIPGATWFVLTGATMHLAGTGTILAGVIRGTLTIGTMNLPVKIVLPNGGTGWVLEPDFTTFALSDLSAIPAMVGISDLAINVPDDLSALKAFTLQNLAVGFNMDDLWFISVVVGLGDHYDIIPNQLAILYPDVMVEVLRPLESDPTRQTGIWIRGIVRIGSVNVPIVFEKTVGSSVVTVYIGAGTAIALPGLNDLFALAGDSSLGSVLPSGLANLGNLSLSNFVLSIDTQARTLSYISFMINAAANWAIPGLEKFTVKDVSFGLAISQPMNKAQRTITGQVVGVVMIGGSDVVLTAQIGQTVTLSGYILKMSLVDLVEAFTGETTLPPELPNLTLTNVAFSMTPATGAFNVQGTCTIAWDMPFGVQGLTASTTTVHIARAGTSSGVTAQIAFNGTNTVAITDGFTITNLALYFNWLSAGNWGLGGTIGATLFGHTGTLGASVTQTADVRTIAFAETTNVSPLLSLGSASISLKKFGVSISKTLTAKAAANPDALSLNSSSAYTWQLAAEGGLKIGSTLNCDGDIVLFKQTNSVGLAFRPNTADLNFALPDPLHSVKIHLVLTYLALTHTTSGTTSSWAIDTSGGLWIEGLPKSVQSIGPSSANTKVTAHLISTETSFSIVVDRLIQPVAFKLPTAQAGQTKLDLGTAVIDASNFQLIVSSSDVVGSMDFGLGLPTELNHILGSGVDIFNVYQANNPNSVTRLRLSLDTAHGMQVALVTPPFKAMTFSTQGSDSYFDANLGDFGKIRALVPVFSYNGVGFAAKGSFTQVAPLKLPLVPLKWLFKACNLDALANSIPDGLSIAEIKIYDTQTKQFDVDGLIGMFQGLISSTVPANLQNDATTALNDAKSALKALSNQLDKLPDLLKDYFDFVLPKSISFEINMTTEGQFNCKVSVDKATPIKLLYPSFNGIEPVLMGLTVYGFSIGEVFDGALMTVGADFIQDTFGLIELFAALTLPLDKLSILPSSRSLAHRLIVRNLFMLLITETAIPIPIPLFYDEFGLEYLGLEGIALQVHFSLPKPSLKMSDAEQIFSNLEKFFTVHSYLLDANTPPQSASLSLTFGPDFLTLPKYLGGKTLGSTTGTYTINAYETLAHALNALKTLSLNEIVEAIPLKYRVGQEHLSFSIMSIDIAWLISTPLEFQTLSYKQVGVASTADAQSLMSVMPKSPTADTQGLVVFLRGAWQIGSQFAVMASFGLIGTTAGFATGIHVTGNVSDFLAIELKGAIAIAPKTDPHFSLTGSGTVTLFDKNILTGTLTVDDTHFYLNGTYNLFPGSSIVNISGSVTVFIDNKRVFFSTKQQVTIGSFVLSAATITLDSASGITITDTWLGQQLTLSLKYTTSSPHTDTAQMIAAHSDVAPTPHADTATAAVQTAAAHTDAVAPHSDTSTHVDQAGVHTDSKSLAHIDLRTAHMDTTTTHIDVASQHNDFVKPHVDTPATHSDTAAITAHGDTNAAVKTPVHSDVSARGTSVILEGVIQLQIHISVDVGAFVDIATGKTLSNDLTVTADGNFTFDTSIGTNGFSLRITGSLKWNSHTLTLPSFTVSVSPKDINDAASIIANQLKATAASVIGAVYAKITDFLKDAAAGLVTAAQDLQPLVNAAKKWGTTAWNATAQWSTNAWKSALKWDATAWNATTSWGDNAWNATTHWGDTAWNATTAWSDDAWNATAHWSTNAWDATASWSNDAWNATTHWSSTAWSATTKWSADAWNATKNWSSTAWNSTASWSTDTWNATTSWSSDVWNKTSSWTADQFNNATKTVSDYLDSLKHIHTDTKAHGDTKVAGVHLDVDGHADKKVLGVHGDVGSDHADFTV
jgi:hypothetical protein